MIAHTGTLPIETERLLLRRYQMSDAQAVFTQWTSDPETSRFWTWSPHENVEETREMLSLWIRAYEQPDNYHWVIVWKETMQPCGYIYLDDLDDGDHSASVHYLVARGLWRRGIATEALNAVLAYAFDTIELRRIHTHHHIDNPASGAVMAKAGMRFLGEEYRSIPECERISGQYARYEIVNCRLSPIRGEE